MEKDFFDRLEEVHWAGIGETFSYPVKSAEINGDAVHIVITVLHQEEHLYGHKDSSCVAGKHDSIYYLFKNEAEWVAKRKAIIDSVFKFKESLSKLQDLLL